MSDASVTVTGLSPATTQESLTHFFTFCGTISSVDRAEKSAKITFAKASAATTALMLDGGSLDGATIHVTRDSATATSTSAATAASSAPSATKAEDGKAHPATTEPDDVHQEDKPRSAVAAELLAHGYILGDKVITSAIDLDQQHGISTRFKSFIEKIDQKFAVAQKATTVQSEANTRAAQLDEKIGVSPKLAAWRAVGRDYYEKVWGSPQGAQAREFYRQQTKMASDVHAEARRIAEERAGRPIFQMSPTSPNKPTDTTAPATQASASAPSAPSTTSA